MSKDTKKTIEYGTKSCHIYPIESGKHTVGFKQLGMRGFKRSVEQEDSTLYADDENYIVVPGNKKVTGDMTFYKLNDAMWERLGWELQTNGAIADSGKKSPFGMAFITTEIDSSAVSDPRLIVCPNLLGKEPEREKTTQEDSVEGEELVVTYTASTLDGFTAESGEEPTMFIVTLEGWSVQEAEALLDKGIPLPTDDFTAKP